MTVGLLLVCYKYKAK